MRRKVAALAPMCQYRAVGIKENPLRRKLPIAKKSQVKETWLFYLKCDW